MYRCKTCKSSSVEGKYWANHNTGEVSSVIETENNSLGDNWCEKCEEYCEIYDDELENLNTNNENN